MILAEAVVQSPQVAIVLAALNVFQAVMLAHIASRSSRVRATDRKAGPRHKAGPARKKRAPAPDDPAAR